jgi:hypothetical protein
MSESTVETARDWPTKAMVGREGDPIGKIAYVYLDRVTQQPTWALVVTGRLRRRPAFVPLTEAVHEDDLIRVPVPEAAVRNAPSLRMRRELSQEHEARLLDHYGELAAGLASSRTGARRVSRRPQAGPRARRRFKQGLEQATSVTTGTGRSRVLRRLLGGGVGLAGSLAATRLLVKRRRAPNRPLATFRSARRRRPLVVVVNARPAKRPRVPSPRPARSRRRSSTLPGDLKLGVGLAVGYLLGARAGRGRYDQIAGQARRIWQRPGAGQPAGEERQTTTAPQRPTSRT